MFSIFWGFFVFFVFFVVFFLVFFCIFFSILYDPPTEWAKESIMAGRIIILITGCQAPSLLLQSSQSSVPQSDGGSHHLPHRWRPHKLNRHNSKKLFSKSSPLIGPGEKIKDSHWLRKCRKRKIMAAGARGPTACYRLGEVGGKTVRRREPTSVV